jgi:primosomal replication protein N
VLRHEGDAVEAHKPRRVVLDLKAKAIGEDLVRQVQAITGDAVYSGFLAAARNGRGVVFHVNTVEPGDAKAHEPR